MFTFLSKIYIHSLLPVGSVIYVSKLSKIIIYFKIFQSNIRIKLKLFVNPRRLDYLDLLDRQGLNFLQQQSNKWL